MRRMSMRVRRALAFFLAMYIAVGTAVPARAFTWGPKTTISVMDTRPDYVITGGEGREFDYDDGEVAVKLRVSGTARVLDAEYGEDADRFDAGAGFGVLVPREVKISEDAEVELGIERRGEGDEGYDEVVAEAGEAYDGLYGVVGLVYKFYLDGHELDMSGCTVEIRAGLGQDALDDAFGTFSEELDAMDEIPEDLGLNMSAYVMADDGPVLAASGSAMPDAAVFGTDGESSGDGMLGIAVCMDQAAVERVEADMAVLPENEIPMAGLPEEEPGFFGNIWNSVVSLFSMEEETVEEEDTEYAEPSGGNIGPDDVEDAETSDEMSESDVGPGAEDDTAVEPDSASGPNGSNGNNTDDIQWEQKDTSTSGNVSWIVVDEFGTWLVIGSGVNAKYVVDYYAWLPVVDKSKEYDQSNLVVYDTSGKRLPKTGDSKNPTVGLTMVGIEDEKPVESPVRGTKYKVKSSVQFRQIYDKFSSDYLSAPRVVYLDRVAGDPDAESNYELCEIWILEGKDAPDGETDNWVKYRKNNLAEWDDLPANEQAVIVEAFDQLHFRTDGSLTSINPEPKPGNDPKEQYYIPLKTADGTQTYIRMVYQPVFCDPDELGSGGAMFDETSTQGVKGIKLVPAQVYDYDITEAVKDDDGNITSYSSGRKDAVIVDRFEGLSGDKKVAWVTNGYGINDFVENVDGYAANEVDGYDMEKMLPFAFGNDNHGTGLGRVAFGTSIAYTNVNRANVVTLASGVQGQGTFGLVKNSLGPDGSLQFADTIIAPDLFGESQGKVVKGRTDYPDATLAFAQVGDTYTLYGAQVSGTYDDPENGTQSVTSELTGLDEFTYWKKNWNGTKSIYSNNFWPLDWFEVPGHDPRLGAAKGAEGYVSVPYNGWKDVWKENGWESMDKSEADDAKPHNGFFGMKYSVDFEIDSQYRGPLEYLFFGDDDLWVYLSELDENGNIVSSELVCDVGGVHTSIGEYVNLYDYIGTGTDNSVPKPGKYRLNVFYLERGDTGSVCWTQFTLPKVTSVRNAESIERSGSALRIVKKVGSVATTDNGLAYEDMADTVDGVKFKFEIALYDANGKPLVDSVLGYITDASGHRSKPLAFWANGLYDVSGTPLAGKTQEELAEMTQAQIEAILASVAKKTGNIIELGAGDVLTIYGLEAGTQYKIREIPVVGYEPRVIFGEIGSSGSVSGTGTGSGGFDADGYYSGSVSGEVYMTYVNVPIPGMQFPATGGSGVGIFIISGAAMALLGVSMIVWRRKRNM